VGDKTIMFWLADKEMYWHMDKASHSHIIDRAMALHKMIRLITCTCAGEGYLNFMGNEFGHPEWIDFPREDNGYSYAHARRRWDLADDDTLRYQYLERFDEAMIRFVKESDVLSEKSELLLKDEEHKILVYRKGGHLFAFNFHPQNDHTVKIELEAACGCELVLHTESPEFGGLRGYAVQGNALPEVFVASRSGGVYRVLK
jgi:1,4-alpha-glucan branching enzyme